MGVSVCVPTGLPGKLRAGEILIVLLVPLAATWINKSAPEYKSVIYRIIGCFVALFIWHGFADLMLGTPTDRVIDVAATFAFTGMKLFVFSGMVLRTPPSAIALLLGMATGNFFFMEEFRTSAAIMRDEYWDLKVANWGGPLLWGMVLLVGKRFKILAIASIFIYGAVAGYYERALMAC